MCACLNIIEKSICNKSEGLTLTFSRRKSGKLMNNKKKPTITVDSEKISKYGSMSPLFIDFVHYRFHLRVFVG